MPRFRINDRTVIVSDTLLIALICMVYHKDHEGTAQLLVTTIKFAREMLGLGLREAKDLVEFLKGNAYLDGRTVRFYPRIIVECLDDQEPTTEYPSVSAPGATSLGELLRRKLEADRAARQETEHDSFGNA